MIPKKIHYCWFGKGEKPDSIKYHIQSWKDKCPDYEIVEWNEHNFDINKNLYCRQAYEYKKWAFVSDYARLWILYNHGGIYLDTDVEVKRNFDSLLTQSGFSGFESDKHVSTAIIASEKGHNYIGELLNSYQNRVFIKDDGELDTSTNVEHITKIAIDNGLILNDSKQSIKGFIYYPQVYFSPYNDITGSIISSDKTYTIHWFSKSWVDKRLKNRLKVTRCIRRIFGVNSLNWFKKVWYK